MAQIKLFEPPINHNVISKNSTRNVGIDIVKSIAILSVVGVHFFLNTRFYRVDLNNPNLFLQVAIQQLFLICIPLFVMSTGYLNNNTKIDKNYFKKILPIIYLYIFYSIPAILYRYSIGELPLDIPLWIEQLFTFKGHRYSWYINLYFGLFLIMPFLNRMYNSLENKQEKKILIGVLITLTCATAFKFLNLPNYWSSIYPLTYFFVGKYIKDFNPTIKLSKNMIYLLLVILFQTIVEYIGARGGKYVHALTDYTSIPRLIEAYLIFILAYQFKIKNARIRNTVINISKLTLDIYLASFITDRLTYKLLKPYNLPQETYLYLMIPLVFISFSLAYGIANLRSRYIKIR